MPQIYLNDLQEIWIDDGEVPKVNVRLWNEFITTLRNDWENSTTPVSCFLTVSSALALTCLIGDLLSLLVPGLGNGAPLG